MKDLPSFAPEAPWEKPPLEDCWFYHCMDFPSGKSVEGPWDIRGHFEDYIGNYPIANKSLLDVGTASGFLAFSAERAGARVTAIDSRDSNEYEMVPFAHTPYHCDRTAWCTNMSEIRRANKNSFWFAWHEFESNVEVCYVPLAMLPFWGRRFDVIVAGAIIVHLADPIVVIGNLAAMADEALILPMTVVLPGDEQVMRTATDWSDPKMGNGWWKLSFGLYRRVFNNLGFDMEILRAPITRKQQNLPSSASTIIARRRPQ